MPSNQPNDDATQIANAIERLLAEGGVATLVTLIAGAGNIGRKLLVGEGELTLGSLGDRALDRAVSEFARQFLVSRSGAQTFGVASFARQLGEWGEAKILCERIEPEQRIVVCGAGHVGAALARLASLIGYRATLIDDRAEFVTRERFPDQKIELVAAVDWTAAVRRAIGSGRGIAVAVVTRGHNEDEECMQAIITTKADYVGLIGSKRRTNIVLDRLRQSGADEDRIGDIHAPIGLDIGAITPEEVALAILAEIVAKRRGGEGLPLSAFRRKT